MQRVIAMLQAIQRLRLILLQDLLRLFRELVENVYLRVQSKILAYKEKKTMRKALPQTDTLRVGTKVEEKSLPPSRSPHGGCWVIFIWLGFVREACMHARGRVVLVGWWCYALGGMISISSRGDKEAQGGCEEKHLRL
jgi:hypothetical protein